MAQRTRRYVAPFKCGACSKFEAALCIEAFALAGNDAEEVKNVAECSLRMFQVE